jgi:hypothetical protein
MSSRTNYDCSFTLHERKGTKRICRIASQMWRWNLRWMSLCINDQVCHGVSCVYCSRYRNVLDKVYWWTTKYYYQDKNVCASFVTVVFLADDRWHNQYQVSGAIRGFCLQRFLAYLWTRLRRDFDLSLQTFVCKCLIRLRPLHKLHRMVMQTSKHEPNLIML